MRVFAAHHTMFTAERDIAMTMIEHVEGKTYRVSIAQLMHHWAVSVFKDRCVDAMVLRLVAVGHRPFEANDSFPTLSSPSTCCGFERLASVELMRITDVHNARAECRFDLPSEPLSQDDLRLNLGKWVLKVELMEQDRLVDTQMWPVPVPSMAESMMKWAV